MSASDFRVDGKVALISGGARGLGAAIAHTLAERGAKVVIADILVREGEQTAAKIGAGRALFVQLDVTKEAEWMAAITAAVRDFGGLDVLVNNAGIEVTSLFADCSLEDFNRTLAVNVSGVFLGVKHGIRAMRPGGVAGRGGSIINMSSAGGIKGVPGLGAYCASKGAVRLMSKSAAVECGKLKYGIRVNSVHPALVKTDMGAKVIKDYVRMGLMPDESAAEIAFAETHLLGIGEPQDVANGVCYLASDASRWVTGSEFCIDGGSLAL